MLLRTGEPRSTPLATKIYGQRLAVSLRLVDWLTLHRDDRPHSLQIEVGDRLGCVPEVHACHLAVARVPDDRGDQCLRWIACIAQAFVPALPLRTRQSDRFNEHAAMLRHPGLPTGQLVKAPACLASVRAAAAPVGAMPRRHMRR